MLERIASYTGGQVFEALNGDDLIQVYSALNELEETLFDSYTIRPKVELYYWPLVMTVFLNLLMLLVAAMRRQRDVLKGDHSG